MTLTPTTSVEDRAKEDRGADHRIGEPWDVVCLNEVFDEDGRAILEQRLGASTPTMSSRQTLDDRLAGALELSAAGTGGRLDLGDRARPARWITLLGSFWEDSGLMLFSRIRSVEAHAAASVRRGRQSRNTLPATLPVGGLRPL